MGVVTLDALIPKTSEPVSTRADLTTSSTPGDPRDSNQARTDENHA